MRKHRVSNKCYLCKSEATQQQQQQQQQQMYNRFTVISQFCLVMISRHSIHFFNGKIYLATDINFFKTLMTL